MQGLKEEAEKARDHPRPELSAVPSQDSGSQLSPTSSGSQEPLVGSLFSGKHRLLALYLLVPTGEPQQPPPYVCSLPGSAHSGLVTGWPYPTRGRGGGGREALPATKRKHSSGHAAAVLSSPVLKLSRSLWQMDLVGRSQQTLQRVCAMQILAQDPKADNRAAGFCTLIQRC